MKKNIDQSEVLILQVADFIYSHMNLKPISKSIFFLSRILLTVDSYNSSTIKELIKDYSEVKKNSSTNFYDDYDFEEIVNQNSKKVDEVISQVKFILSTKKEDDFTGQIFNTLLRGKYEAGEGMGTFLTPAEVTDTMCEMVFETRKAISNKDIKKIADIAGGTGRFIISAKSFLNKKGFTNKKLSKMLYSYEQSTLHNSLNKINFELFGMNPQIYDVSDSIIDNELKKEKQFDILLTNPPFGKNKYIFSKEILNFFSEDLLININFYKKGSTIDPCEIFFLKNLLLLKDEGVLGIILPDGFAKSNKIEKYLHFLEEVYGDKYVLNCRVSLPKQTFALTGTVALSSFLIISKNPSKIFQSPFTRVAKDIGYIKSGNKKVYIENNDLPKFIKEYKSFISSSASQNKKTKKFNTCVSDFFRKRNVRFIKTKQKDMHISILDVDNTGFFDVNSAIKNNPISSTKYCEAGDILISCINPSKWRVFLVPNCFPLYSCSSEFIVLEAKDKSKLVDLFISFFSDDFQKRAIEIAKGTSSSRQKLKIEISLKNFYTNVSESICKEKKKLISFLRFNA